MFKVILIIIIAIVGLGFISYNYTSSYFTAQAVVEGISFSTAEEFPLEIPPQCTHINFSGPPIIGTSEDDYIRGGSGNNLIIALEGNNTIHGGSGNDCIVVGSGNNIINGGSGNDVIIVLGDGVNIIKGGSGNDTIYGSGNDEIDGGTGQNYCEGGITVRRCQLTSPLF